MSEAETSAEASRPSIGEELSRFWREIPDKPLFLALLGSWLLFFHLLGNSTFGYVDTPSLFGWMNYAYGNSKDDELGYIIPLIVLGLCYWKRDELLAASKRNWWPAMALVVMALVVHLIGYVIQQARISIVGFYLGVYALTGLVWGPAWLRASFFPCFLFAFAVPLGTLSEFITVPLQHISADFTGWILRTLLGVEIVQQGVKILDTQGRFEFGIAAACAGLRSLIVTLAFSTIYGFVAFTRRWKMTVIILSAFPLAMAGNMLRMTTIILAAELTESINGSGGQAAGDFFHGNALLNLMPYVTAFVGMFVLGRLIGEDGHSNPRESEVDSDAELTKEGVNE